MDGCAHRYGYFRPTIRLFDPGWHGLQVKGAEDENTGDNGNDPLGVLARYAVDAAALAWLSQSTIPSMISRRHTLHALTGQHSPYSHGLCCPCPILAGGL